VQRQRGGFKDTKLFKTNNMFKNWKFTLKHFKDSEVEAQKQALAFTTQIKNILLSKEVLTIEKLTGTQELGADALALLERYIAIINKLDLSADIDALETLLGGIGARLTGIIHEGCAITSGIRKWIMVFEGIFELNKK